MKSLDGRWLVAVAAVLGLTGCAVIPGLDREADRPPPTPATVASGWPGCLELRPAADTSGYEGPSGGIPTDFAPSRAVICDTESRTRADKSEVTVAVEKTATDIGDLVAALRLPSRESLDPNQACRASGWVEPWLFLLDSRGRWIHPQIPVDPCNLPRSEVDAALNRLETTSVELAVVTVNTSAAAAKAGCTQQWKNMIEVTLDQPGSSASVEPITADPFEGRPLRLCAYDTSGSFEHGGPLDDGRRAAVIGALRTSGGTPSRCDQQSSGFTLLRQVDDNGPLVYVEIDGCHRVLVSADRDTVTVASADLIELLR